MEGQPVSIRRVQTLRRTPLHAAHVALGARMVPFAGWDLPVQYEGVIEEHRAVREDCGAFDVSHMGEIEIEGPRARELLAVAALERSRQIGSGQAQYTLLTNERRRDRRRPDRLPARPRTASCSSSTRANASADFEWIKEREIAGSDVRDVSDEYGLIAVQGPRSLERLGLARRAGVHVRGGRDRRHPCMVNRTGYTGELGVELL